jgi:MFS family permease
VAGLRTFNAKFIAAISVVYMTAGCNNNIVSLILPLVESEYGVTSAQSYLLVSINQLGLLVGTLFSAKLPGSRKSTHWFTS